MFLGVISLTHEGRRIQPDHDERHAEGFGNKAQLPRHNRPTSRTTTTTNGM